MSKVAVVFWSATGNTETMANCVETRYVICKYPITKIRLGNY